MGFLQAENSQRERGAGVGTHRLDLGDNQLVQYDSCRTHVGRQNFQFSENFY